ncbi:transmembrane protein 65 isoform X2 [Belonocnema kinseyi]|uniref:transmembrane protein 65 isoform X2 n=1 Tax=Belonocnema kinseyi TaxID=2817044 RepID=UPI00143DC6EC|nr:transmembrane protein 65 isoform X2 [Belonocnema kinseyi]
MCIIAKVPGQLVIQVGRNRLLQLYHLNRYSWASVNLSGFSAKTLLEEDVRKNWQLQKKTFGSATRAAISNGTLCGALSKQQAKDLAVKLTPDERTVLISALQECQSLKIKAEFEADSTTDESFATVPQPSNRDLMRVLIANAIPFIGFGFLDNFIMIIAGDQIEVLLGTWITLSTMAAAAIGNTFSDVLGIGSAYYVEVLAQKIGFKQPKLTPIQLNMPKSRRSANIGRVLGVTIGCILGMTPLLFLRNDKKKESAENELPALENKD